VPAIASGMAVKNAMKSIRMNITPFSIASATSDSKTSGLFFLDEPEWPIYINLTERDYSGVENF
jgi:hypothetical protein